MDTAATSGDGDWTTSLREALSSDAYKPPILPRVALQVAGLSRAPDVSIDEIVSLLSQDPLITGRILKVVRSPLYTGRTPIGDLHEAITRIGLKTLREIVWQVALGTSVFQSPHYTAAMERTRRHSAATAYVTRTVMRYCSLRDDSAFLVGLFHDCGIAGALSALSEVNKGRPVPELSEAWSVVLALHEYASARMTRLWDLPLDLQMAVGHHHGSDAEQTDELTAVVCLANHVANQLGFGVVDKSEPMAAALDECEPNALAAALTTLGIPQPSLALIQAEAQDLLERAVL